LALADQFFENITDFIQVSDILHFVLPVHIKPWKVFPPNLYDSSQINVFVGAGAWKSSCNLMDPLDMQGRRFTALLLRHKVL
jgi:hypothetical protein